MSSNKITCSIESLATKSGLMKLLETVLGTVCLGMTLTGLVLYDALIFFQFWFLICILCTLSGTFLLLLSNIVSPVTTASLSNSLFEILHHGFSFLFYTGTSLAFLIMITAQEDSGFDKATAAAALGLVNSALYFVSAFYSYKSFKEV